MNEFEVNLLSQLHCQGIIDLFKTGGGEALAHEMNVPFLGRVPIDPQIVRCGDAGSPYVHRFAESPAAQAIHSIVENIVNFTKSNVPDGSDR